jgi:hypothetical protein
LYPHSLGYGDNLDPDEKAQERYWYQRNRYYHFTNPDPSIDKYAEISTDEIFQLLYDKIKKDIYRIYKVRSGAIIGKDLKHAVIRKLAYKLFQKVQEIDQFERHNSGDLRNHFTNYDFKQENHE